MFPLDVDNAYDLKRNVRDFSIFSWIQYIVNIFLNLYMIIS